MLRGVYSSASGMISATHMVDMYAANIANSQTAGYKRKEMTSVPFKELLINVANSDGKVSNLLIGTGSGTSYMSTDARQGPLKSTGNSLDFAISGNAMFSMQKVNNQGTREYTSRNGQFLLNADNFIVNTEGDYLLDENNNRIKIPNTNNNSVGDLNSRLILRSNGVLFDNGTELAKLKMQTDTNIVNYVSATKTIEPVQQVVQRTANGALTDINGNAIRIEQGFLENSNVQIISEIMGLMHAAKNYESGHKLITTEDKILDKAINELGRTG